MIGEPILPVFCDNNTCDEQGEFDMTPLARGGYDTRNVRSKLIKLGWIVDEELTFCCNYCYEDYKSMKISKTPIV